ncbi:unnamed protein product, partial [Rotaria sp. Silwood2]
MLIHQTIGSKIVDATVNFILIELDVLSSFILVGGVYVPPNEQPPFELFSKCIGKEYYIFGDFNAKHPFWLCETGNVSGTSLKEWMEANGCEGIFPAAPTSKRSSAIIDFALTHDSSGWTLE